MLAIALAAISNGNNVSAQTDSPVAGKITEMLFAIFDDFIAYTLSRLSVAPARRRSHLWVMNPTTLWLPKTPEGQGHQGVATCSKASGSPMIASRVPSLPVPSRRPYPAWLRTSGRPPAWRNAEILLLRHQLAVLQRQTAARPRLAWTDRALFAALLALIPRARHSALHLFITPGTILRWHRDIVRRRWATAS
jgi:hypothetical protein